MYDANIETYNLEWNLNCELSRVDSKFQTEEFQLLSWTLHIYKKLTKPTKP